MRRPSAQEADSPRDLCAGSKGNRTGCGEKLNCEAIPRGALADLTGRLLSGNEERLSLG